MRQLGLPIGKRLTVGEIEKIDRRLDVLSEEIERGNLSARRLKQLENEFDQYQKILYESLEVTIFEEGKTK